MESSRVVNLRNSAEEDGKFEEAVTLTGSCSVSFMRGEIQSSNGLVDLGRAGSGTGGQLWAGIGVGETPSSTLLSSALFMGLERGRAYKGGGRSYVSV